MRGDTRSRAMAVLIMFAATVGIGVILVVAFEPEIQTIDTAELVARSDDARAFLVADYGHGLRVRGRGRCGARA